MKSDNKHTTRSCTEWAGQIDAVLSLPEDDEILLAWAAHAESCTECRQSMHSELSIRRQIRTLPEPGNALIADSVMRRVRSGNLRRPVIGIRDFGLGLAGAVAGVFLGVYLAGTFNQPTATDLAAGYEQILSEVGDGLDPLIDELFSESGGS